MSNLKSRIERIERYTKPLKEVFVFIVGKDGSRADIKKELKKSKYRESINIIVQGSRELYRNSHSDFLMS